MAVVLVTGCSSGFGEAIAVRCAELGHEVIATMRRPDAASQSLGDHPGVRVKALDVTDAEARARVLANTLR